MLRGDIKFFSCFAGLGVVGGLLFGASSDYVSRRSASNRPIGVISLPPGVSASEVVGQISVKENLSSSKPLAENSRGTVVEFADYECPPCQRLYEELKSNEIPGNGTSLVFRNFPLTSIHRQAYYAALAAEAAREQGRFWQMHDMLYDHQRDLSEKDIDGYAKQIGLDMSLFERSMKSTAKHTVDSDIAEAQKIGIIATPTLLLCDSTGKVNPISLVDAKRQLK